MPRIVLAVCAKYPQLSASNAAFAAALQSKGCDVRVLSWNGAPIELFLDSDLILLRQTWDYQDDPGGFAAWVSRVSDLDGNIENPPRIAIWNNDKRTLSEVAGAGVPVPATCRVTPGGAAGIFCRVNSERVVLKPAFGGGGTGVRLCSEENFECQLRDAQSEAPGRPFLAQAFLPEIAAGEWKMTCIGGRVAFAVHAVPKPGEFRINSRFGPKMELARPPSDAIAAAEKILDWIGQPLICCRIDGVMRGADFICTELELTDPDLNLDFFDAGADLLAEATLEHLAPS